MFKNNRSIKFVKNIKDFKRSENDFFAEILGEHCELEYTFYNEISVKLQFPYYFGRNFDALEECINDFEWFEDVDNIHYNRFLIYIKNPEKILNTVIEKQRKIFFDIIQRIENEKVIIIFDEKDFNFLMKYNINFLNKNIIFDMDKDLLSANYNNYENFFKKYETVFNEIVNIEDKNIEFMVNNFNSIRNIYVKNEISNDDKKSLQKFLLNIKHAVNLILKNNYLEK